jgi:hypothetical protein
VAQPLSATDAREIAGSINLIPISTPLFEIGNYPNSQFARLIGAAAIDQTVGTRTGLFTRENAPGDSW